MRVTLTLGVRDRSVKGLLPYVILTAAMLVAAACVMQAERLIDVIYGGTLILAFLPLVDRESRPISALAFSALSAEMVVFMIAAIAAKGFEPRLFLIQYVLAAAFAYISILIVGRLPHGLSTLVWGDKNEDKVLERSSMRLS